MKKMMMLALCLLLMLPALALAQHAVLLVQMPETAQMVENVEFDDGDFIQSYQLGSTNVQLVRYGAFEMTIGDLLESEWVGCTEVTDLGIAEISGYAASGVQFSYVQGDQAARVTLILVDAGSSTLVFTASAPQGDSDAQNAVAQMIEEMQVLSDRQRSEEEVG